MAGFVVLEGIDGSGKSSVAKAVVDALGEHAVLTFEPTDSWVGAAARKGAGKEISPYTDALLFMADRAQHTLEIADLVKDGRLVVSDRYYHSTVAYQTAALKAAGKGDNFEWLLDANTRISLRPDITFIVFVDPEVALQRVGRRGELSRFERLEFLKDVQANYDRLARLDDTVVRLDGTEPLENVVGRVLDTVRKAKL
ncbi:MAG: dTMP kinase [Thermoplasmata archaeon]|jgi:dTMP kinase|nr:dTMP kinase [Thermoplasmata archaeon]